MTGRGTGGPKTCRAMSTAGHDDPDLRRHRCQEEPPRHSTLSNPRFAWSRGPWRTSSSQVRMLVAEGRSARGRPGVQAHSATLHSPTTRRLSGGAWAERHSRTGRDGRYVQRRGWTRRRQRATHVTSRPPTRVRCRRCGGDVYPTAQHCPHCGGPGPGPGSAWLRRSRWVANAAMVVVLGAIGMTFALGYVASWIGGDAEGVA